ncbi:MAG: dockerin type I domain-containing protein [Oscillospiraceae bacterium]|nr:dockerin type I domain-containing protein [Oscillospiraceae bacterium]
MKKQLFSLMLCLILLLVPISPALAETNEEGMDLYWVMPDEECVEDMGEDEATVTTDTYYDTLDGEHYELEHKIPLPGLFLGDVNEDGSITARDIALTWLLAQGQKPSGANKSLADYNQDGKLTLLDVSSVWHLLSSGCANIRANIAGDVNCDGALNSEDTALIEAYLVDGSTSGMNLAMADFNGDGKVTQDDADALSKQVKQRWNGHKIYISPSNQNANTYSYGNTNEAVQCNLIGFEVQKGLMRCGFATYLADYCDNMDIRAGQSNAWGADLHLPLHTNAHYPPGNYDNGGTQVYYDPDDATAAAMAKVVFSSLSAVTPGNSAYQGLRTNQTWKEIVLVKAPTVYCEMEYHDVASFAQWIIGHRSTMAEAIVKGICNYYGVTYVAP